MGADYRERGLRYHYYDGSKIADITEADILQHQITPAALGLPANTVYMHCDFVRVAGTGNFGIRTLNAAQIYSVPTTYNSLWPVDNNGVFLYLLSVANDDWDIFCFGYWTQ